MFSHLSPVTLHRVADFLERGGRPLARWERQIARRALALADQDHEDAAAILRVAA